MNDTYKGFTWKERVKFESETLQGCDFTETIFENASFKDVTFENCLFFKSNMNHIGLWSSRFLNCKFINADLRNMSMGADGGLFESCLFQKCDFRGQYFWHSHFNKCIFENCKLKKIDFNDSSFHYCKFVGKLENVTFNGIYHKKETGLKPLDYVDFSEAIFGEYVSFDRCDLSTCIPPKGETFDDLLYAANLNNPDRLSTGIKEKYAFHDGNVDNIQIGDNDILIEFELLNFENSELENIIVKFSEYYNLIYEGNMLNNWNVSSGTILNYFFENNFIKLFLEIDNFETKEINYLTISFNYK